MNVVWIAIISIIFVIIAAYLAITKILPVVRDLLSGIVDGRVMGAFMSLLIIVVYILVLDKVVNLLLAAENQYLNYLSYITPGITVLTDLLPYLKYVLLGALIAWGLKLYKK